MISSSLNLTCTFTYSCLCLGGPSSVSPTHNCGILLMPQDSVQKKSPVPCPAPLCIMRRCTHVVNSLFNLSFTNLHNLSHHSTCHSALCIGGIQENFNGFSIFTTIWSNEARNTKDAIRNQDKEKNKPHRYPEQLRNIFTRVHDPARAELGHCPGSPGWLRDRPPCRGALSFPEEGGLPKPPQLPNSCSPGTLAFASQEELAPQGLATAQCAPEGPL